MKVAKVLTTTTKDRPRYRPRVQEKTQKTHTKNTHKNTSQEPKMRAKGYLSTKLLGYDSACLLLPASRLFPSCCQAWFKLPRCPFVCFLSVPVLPSVCNVLLYADVRMCVRTEYVCRCVGTVIVYMRVVLSYFRTD